MKAIIILFMLMVVSINLQAQLGSYRKTVYNKYKDDIVQTDSIRIIVQDDQGISVFLFTDNFCTEVYFILKGYSGKDLKDLIESDSVYTKSERGNWWYYALKGDDAKTYHVILEIWYDNGDIPHLHAYLNKEL